LFYSVKGSTVEIPCTYSYPPRIGDKKTVVQRRFWFTELNSRDPLDLREDPDYADRNTYHFSKNNCLLRISDLKLRDSAEYKFRIETNQHGGSYTGSPGVTLTVTVNTPVHQVPGSVSVTLTCSSDANPAVKYTWFKDNQGLLSGGPYLILLSVHRSDSGKYHCVAENELGKTASEYVSINVEYPPKTSNVSVNVSGKILEGSSVTLTCSSDANPAANYTWFKKDEDSPKASGPNWTISDFRAELSGVYYCEQNSYGSSRLKVDVTRGFKSFLLSFQVHGNQQQLQRSHLLFYFLSLSLSSFGSGKELFYT
uniref:Ig-like domain-containing protein n=1 Tax=Oryzias melastigma TaxID=30732 RepID=A0A3B3DCV2_ORYME